MSMIALAKETFYFNAKYKEFLEFKALVENESYTEDGNGNTSIQNRNIVGAWKASTTWQDAVSKSSEITENS